MRVTSNALIRARRLRRNMSLPEVLLWRCLRGREPGKPVFRRQHPLGPFVLDFFCPNASLCIEIDGGGHGFGDQPQRDARRDGYLRSLGIRTIRLNASDVIASPQTFADGLIALAVECSGNLPRSGSVRGRWIAAEERRDGGGASSGKA